jgi:hypothetical protein
MKKRIARYYFMLILLAPLFGWSQKKTFISVGGELVFPAANYMEVGKTGFGGSLRLEHSWSKHVSGFRAFCRPIPERPSIITSGLLLRYFSLWQKNQRLN